MGFARSFYKYFVCFSLSENGPWKQVLDKTLEDSRNQNDPLPLQAFNFNSVTARYVKFKLLSYWGYGGGLQYFNVKKFDYAVLRATAYPRLFFRRRNAGAVLSDFSHVY